MDVKDLFENLGIADPSGPLDTQINFRADAELIQKLNALEAGIRGAGYRVSRSDIIRALVSSSLTGYESTLHRFKDQLQVADYRKNR